MKVVTNFLPDMPEIPLILKEKREIAHNTMEFVFEKPAGFDYKPGQFMTLIYPDQPYTDAKGNRRSMSFASSPTEPEISFGMRMSMSAYKRSLTDAPIGAKLSGIGPAGRFLLPEDPAAELVFLAGGIGITPFRSMVKYLTDKNIPSKATLIYCNNCLRDTSYLPEFTAWEKQNPNLKLMVTMTDPDQVEKEWTGRCGLITEELLKEVVSDIVKPTYMIVGPPGMVEAMVRLLKSLNVLETQIKIEKFTGYEAQ
ncbi:MAG: FAD-dependent oxidoreductase [Parcubacteria group bacterium]